MITSDLQSKQAIEAALKNVPGRPLADAATVLFQSLGYSSKKRLKLTPNNYEQFLSHFSQGKTLNHKTALPEEWKSIDFLFQLTDDEVRAASNQSVLFDSKGAFEGTTIESYLFFALDLKGSHYTRTALAGITRELNKLFAMPALILFRHGDTLSLAIIHRRLHKREQSRDVLEKVTLIKDIRCADPIRAHIEILNDFTLTSLEADFGVANFVALHAAWRERLGSFALNERFYREIADWYFWAHHLVDEGTIRLPQHCDTKEKKSLFLIRLLTRLIFCWFLVEKRLIPAELFRDYPLSKLLKDVSLSAPTYYHAVLQNLFFGTLNMPPEQRGFREKKKDGERFDQNYGITNLWRYESDFRNASEWPVLASRVPFLNGGLFDCLDEKVVKQQDNLILDGFSDNPHLTCHLPNDLFFGPERIVDLSKDYDEADKRTARSKKAKVRGLVGILSRYKFTIEENTPLEEEIALDPELLGKVFENLLASFNEDTRTTARKALGAFYTPREIVSYMVDEALKSYLGSQVPHCKGALEDLFSNNATLKDIKPDTRGALISAIGRVKILDPACGSGAFPMGALHRLVDLLQKLDPNNEAWKRDRLADARRERERLAVAGAAKDELLDADARLKDIEESFNSRQHALDFARKLYLIENCIYGVDIQPIATQIAKLRFFVSLIVDQQVDPKAPNLGMRALPNLETRLVAADALIPVERSEADLFMDDLDRLRAELAAIRHEHFNARTPATKRKWRERDQLKRQEIAQRLEHEGALSHKSAKKLAAWDPYNQNVSAPFFDPEWMFGRTVTDASRPKTAKPNEHWFDIVIGNPPYVRQEHIKHLKDELKKHYACFTGTADLYVFFYEAGIRFLREGGTFSFITSHKFFRAAYGANLRSWLTRYTRILQLIDFGDAPVFTAIAYPCIVILQKVSSPPSDVSIRALNWEPELAIEAFGEIFARRSFGLPQKELVAEGWRLETGTNLRLLETLRGAGKPLGEYVKSHFYTGIKTGLNEAFFVDQVTRDALVAEHKSSDSLLKPALRGRDVKRWRCEFDGQYVIQLPSSENVKHPWSGKSPKDAERIFASQFPAISRHLKSFGDAIVSRYDQGHYYWELRSCAYWDEFSRAKIMIPAIQNAVHYAPDCSGLFSNNKTSFLVADDIEFLLAVLNSSVSWWITRQTFTSKQSGFYEFIPVFVSQMPVPTADEKQRALIERVVKFLTWLHQRKLPADAMPNSRDPLMTAHWERVLNGLVYELYLPTQLHEAGLRVFDAVAQAKLPDIESIAEDKRLCRLRETFEGTYEGSHPLRIALDKLQTLDTVRIIEGKV